MSGPKTPAVSTWSRLAAAPLVWLFDVGMSAAVMTATLLVRFQLEHKPPPDHVVGRGVMVFTLLCAAVFPANRLHRGLWRYTSLTDVVRIARAVLIADLLVLPVLFLINRAEEFPRSTIVIVAPVLIAALTLPRLLAHGLAHGGLSAALSLPDRTHPGAVLVGSPEAAAAWLGARRRGPHSLRVLGLVTTAPVPNGRTIQGIEVLGELPRLTSILKALTAVEDAAPQVVLAEPRPSRDLIQQVVDAAADAGARVLRIRSGGGGVEPIQAADLLDRPPRRLDPERVGRLVAGKRVLVTGAGGTIGGELTRQLLPLGPERLVLFDASEFNLYAIDQELRASGAPAIWCTVLGDVRDARRLAEVFAQERPDVVVHAAALKHVPLMEQNPLEAVLTNVGGAVNVARLARDACEALVFISTDKAVNPTNVMGATKRVAERSVQAITAGGHCRTAAVRFGNVLGSTGSVVPLFERQIAEGGPITLTHPDVIRFFMTVQEAASLVLQAAALPHDGGAEAGQGRVYVLDMGEPVRIDDLARQLIRLHGLRPDVDILIRHTGLRPGEKMSEEIFYAAETVRPTEADGVLAAYDPAPDWTELESRVEALIAAAQARDEPEALRLLHALEPAFRRV